MNHATLTGEGQPRPSQPPPPTVNTDNEQLGGDLTCLPPSWTDVHVDYRDGAKVRVMSTAAITPVRPRLLYSREEAAYLLSISERALDYLVAKKEITVRRMGRKILIPHGELVKFARQDHACCATD